MRAVSSQYRQWLFRFSMVDFIVSLKKLFSLPYQCDNSTPSVSVQVRRNQPDRDCIEYNQPYNVPYEGQGPAEIFSCRQLRLRRQVV